MAIPAGKKLEPRNRARARRRGIDPEIGKTAKMPGRKRRSLGRDDTLVSAEMLEKAVREILSRVTLDRTWDIPYLAGYSRNGKTIYIDRHLPGSFRTRGKEVAIDQFLILHEAVEKSLLDELGLVYQHAHQIALRAEEAAVRAEGVSWRDYDRFMDRFIKDVGDEHLNRIPPDLDIKPYRDEHDTAVLRAMQKVIQREQRQGTRGRPGTKAKGRTGEGETPGMIV
ncbi:MAG: hypothetical protein ABSD81_00205 [Methanomicrobiales archaeon]|jgi:hypothetical protein